MTEYGGWHALVLGRVQDVYFRQFVVEHARVLGLVGFVRNLPDGHSLEVTAEGPRPALAELLRLLEVGPPRARVERVEVEWTEGVTGFRDFQIRH
ncbi:MAG: acylphosphatase [Chloroflexi bacterium]|nr:acylphosphatase [Chloroflexota bacterium]